MVDNSSGATRRWDRAIKHLEFLRDNCNDLQELSSLLVLKQLYGVRMFCGELNGAPYWFERRLPVSQLAPWENDETALVLIPSAQWSNWNWGLGDEQDQGEVKKILGQRVVSGADKSALGLGVFEQDWHGEVRTANFLISKNLMVPGSIEEFDALLKDNKKFMESFDTNGASMLYFGFLFIPPQGLEFADSYSWLR